MQIFRSSVQALINSSVVVKAAIGVLIASYLIGWIPGAYYNLSITPALLLPPNFRIWTLLTGLVVEKSFINLIINIPIIILSGRHLEPLWGALEVLKFIAITSVGCALFTSFVSLGAYAISQNFSLWVVQFSGMAGVIGGISVAFKQIIPDQVIDLRYYKARVHDGPLVALLIYTFLSVIRFLSYTQPIMVTCGIIVGWVYLRFYQSHGKGIRGDMNETFEAATLFPTILRPAVNLLSIAIFKIFVSLGLCKNPVRTYDVGAPSSITINLPGTDPADAERRRKKALRALNERLQHMQDSKPDDEDEEWPGLANQENAAQDADSDSTDSFVKVVKEDGESQTSDVANT